MLWHPAHRRIVRVRQHDVTDCGAACLASVAAYYGRRVPLPRIRQLASTDQRGTTVLGMLEAAGGIGMLARGVRGSYEALPTIPKPIVAHMMVGGSLQHFVVVHSVSRRGVVLMDPADGRVHRVPEQRFREQWTGVMVLLAPGEEFRRGDERVGQLARFWRLVRPHRTVMLHALLAATLQTLLGVSIAVYVQKLVDHVLTQESIRLLHLLSLGMLVLLGVQVHLGAVRSLLTLRVGQQIDAVLILGYYRHLLRLPQRFFDTMRVGEVLSRVNDAVRIRAFISDVSLDLMVNLLVVGLTLALLLAYHWRLALVAFAVLPLYALILALTNRANRSTERQAMERSAELEAQLVESLGAAGTIHRFDVAEHAARRTEQRLVQLLRTVYRSGLVSVASGSATLLTSQAATVTLLWVGAGLVISRSISPGELMSCYTLIGYLTRPVGSLIAANRSVQDALIAADRLFEILELECEPQEGEPVPIAPGEIRFEGVTFRYGARAEVLSGLWLTIPRGGVIAVVGESGSGKSTLAALLHKLYTPQAGRIRIGELDLRYLQAASVRRMVALVPQRIDLLTGSVIENVALGDPEPDLARVVRACADAGLLEFVESLPDGLGSQLGENGSTLSGGQRQRLAIARALYRDPQVLVLDEATSSLDPTAELQVQRVVGKLRDRGRTVILIAHRLSLARTADRIAVLAGGRVVEEGTHDELLLRAGHYARLWRDQQAPAAPTDPPRTTAFPRPQPAGPHAAGAPSADWLRSI